VLEAAVGSGELRVVDDGDSGGGRRDSDVGRHEEALGASTDSEPVLTPLHNHGREAHHTTWRPDCHAKITTPGTTSSNNDTITVNDTLL
jgi:hypothetical protein